MLAISICVCSCLNFVIASDVASNVSCVCTRPPLAHYMHDPHIVALDPPTHDMTLT